MECCSPVELTSAKSDETLKALGLYTIKQGSIIENRPVYIEEDSGSHLLFGLDGWKVIPSTPEDNDPPLVSFIHCKPPRESVCPDRCINDGNWTFFSQAEGKDQLDTEKQLGLSCFNAAEDEKDDTSLILGICLGILFLFVLVTIFIVYKYWRRRQDASKNTPDISMRDLQGEDNTSKVEVEVEEQVPFVDEFQVSGKGVAEETTQTFLKVKIVVNLTPKCVQMPLDEVITINCDPPAALKHPYRYDISFTNTSNNTIVRVEVPPNGKIHFRDLNLKAGEYKCSVEVKGKSDNTELEGWITELFNVYPGPSVKREDRFYSAVMAKNNAMLWERSEHVVENLPNSGILNDTILFRLPLLMPRNSVLKISTIVPSDIFICQGEGKREAWHPDSLISDPYMYNEQKEKVITSNGNLSIFYTETKLSDKSLSIKLPKTEKTNSSISIFVKKHQDKDQDGDWQME